MVTSCYVYVCVCVTDRGLFEPIPTAKVLYPPLGKGSIVQYCYALYGAVNGCS